MQYAITPFFRRKIELVIFFAKKYLKNTAISIPLLTVINKSLLV